MEEFEERLTAVHARGLENVEGPEMEESRREGGDNTISRTPLPARGRGRTKRGQCTHTHTHPCWPGRGGVGPRGIRVLTHNVNTNYFCFILFLLCFC